MDKNLTDQKIISTIWGFLIEGYLSTFGAGIKIISEDYYSFAFDPKLNMGTTAEMMEEIGKKQITSISFNDIKFADDKCHYKIVAHVLDSNKPKYEIPFFLKVRKRTQYKN